MLLYTQASGQATWLIDGNLGADGYGNIQQSSYYSALSVAYYGVRKTVCGEYDPSVNHMWVTDQGDALYSMCAESTDSDCDLMTIIEPGRLMLAMYHFYLFFICLFMFY